MKHNINYRRKFWLFIIDHTSVKGATITPADLSPTFPLALERTKRFTRGVPNFLSTCKKCSPHQWQGFHLAFKSIDNLATVCLPTANTSKT